MKIKTENYVCSICGKRNVKLWHPFLDIGPLLCAECAEKRQTPLIAYKKRWKVDEDGRVPSYIGPNELSESMTNRLYVDLSEVSGSVLSSKCTSMVPAYPKEDGYFYCYNCEPEEIHKWWNALPTR